MPAEPLLLRYSASGAEEREGGQREVKPMYRTEFADREVFLKYAGLALGRYLADHTDLKAIITLGKQDARTKPASVIANAAKADVVVPTAQSHLRFTRFMPR